MLKVSVSKQLAKDNKRTLACVPRHQTKNKYLCRLFCKLFKIRRKEEIRKYKKSAKTLHWTQSPDTAKKFIDQIRNELSYLKALFTKHCVEIHPHRLSNTVVRQSGKARSAIIVISFARRITFLRY